MMRITRTGAARCALSGPLAAVCPITFGSQAIANAQNRLIVLLIATDVLSEGQNLQDAQYLVNYDLHWNPVRMIQRAGRVDRLFSPHELIFIYNIMPESELESLLKLVARLSGQSGVDRRHGWP
jgi:superfamily II DNA/RNA helicase